ncbi:membrane-associated protein, putative [Bodo saltans]|uniref:Membrane-associated protein, putative n=1 Tax=Bodo saltans TaxID=75058 RepID=A0A0S4JBS8_BODSA|nr:membrane-associated protein, putative [Bodo saltans]|eukprot:CUG87427.1 membrane-associated protein, putative [Bodo saltans]
MSNTNVCRGQLSVVAFAYLLSLLLQLLLAQPLVLASKVYSVTIQVLGVVSCGAVTVALVQNEEKETLSVTVAIYTMLMIALLSTVKSLVDLVGLAVAFPVAMKKAHSRIRSMQKKSPSSLLAPPLLRDEKVCDEGLVPLPDSVSEALSRDNRDDDEQFMIDAAFTVVEVISPDEDASILNCRDAPEDPKGKPFDFIRDAAWTTDDELCALKVEGLQDLVDLVFSENQSTARISDAMIVSDHHANASYLECEAVADLDVVASVRLTANNTPTSMPLLMHLDTLQTTISATYPDNPENDAVVAQELSDDFLAPRARPDDDHLIAEEPLGDLFAPLSRSAVRGIVL